MNKYLDTFYDWWKNIDKFILLLILTLFLLGLFFHQLSTSLIASDKLNTKSYYFFLNTCLHNFSDIDIDYILFLNQKIITKFSLILFLVSFLSLLLVPFLGIEVKGSKRWLDLLFLPRFQPVEIVKPFFIVALSFMLTIENKRLYFKYLLSTLFTVPILILLVYQPDIGQTLLISMVWLALIFISGINIFVFFTFFFIIGSSVSYLVLFVPKFEYIKIRLFAFLDSSSSNNYQAEKASDAIINGGFFGKGIGEGTLNSESLKLIQIIQFQLFRRVWRYYSHWNFIFISNFFIQGDSKNQFSKRRFIKTYFNRMCFFNFVTNFYSRRCKYKNSSNNGNDITFLSYGGSSIVSTAILSGLILNLTKRKLN